MDNQTHNSQNEWVDNRLASLVPPGDWRPDSKRALAQTLKRRDRPEAEGGFRWVRLSMAAAVLASIGVVVALLPWQALLRKEGAAMHPNPESARPATPPPISPAIAAVAVQEKARPSNQEQRTVEHIAPEETVSQTITPKTEPESSDQARRAHIQGTVVQTPPERVGRGVTAPRLIGTPVEPDYTDEARQSHIQGTVVLEVIIRADGIGKVEKVVRGLGHGLDEKAIESFEKWRFEPAKKDGIPVDVQIQAVINFHLY